MNPPGNWFVVVGVGVVAAALGFAAGIQYQAAKSQALNAVEPKLASTPAVPSPPPIVAAAEKPTEPERAPPAVEPVPASPAETDPWIERETASEIDDSPLVILTTLGEERQNRYGQSSYPSLHIRCQERKTEIYINTDEYLGNDSISVAHRIDDAKAITSNWSISTDYKAIFARDSITLSRRLLNKKVLTIRLTPYGENTITLRFDVSQLDMHLLNVAKACGWKL